MGTPRLLASAHDHRRNERRRASDPSVAHRRRTGRQRGAGLQGRSARASARSSGDVRLGVPPHRARSRHRLRRRGCGRLPARPRAPRKPRSLVARRGSRATSTWCVIASMPSRTRRSTASLPFRTRRDGCSRLHVRRRPAVKRVHNARRKGRHGAPVVSRGFAGAIGAACWQRSRGTDVSLGVLATGGTRAPSVDAAGDASDAGRRGRRRWERRLRARQVAT